jgi:hypothetical protein
MAREIFTAWITKYALTEGILKMKVRDCFDISADMVVKVDGQGYEQAFHDKDWHRSHEEAIARAKDMQAAKLKSIDKQRKRIAALTFEPKEEGK